MLLDDIKEKRRRRVEEKKRSLPLGKFLNDVFKIERRDFLNAVRRKDKIKIIAEIKYRSPTASKLLCKPATQMAKEYERGGACAVSVVIEQDFFGGDTFTLKRVKEEVRIPILCKDFMIDDYQLYEARYFGADAVLLIAALYDKKTLVHMLNLCKELELDAVVEVHTETELFDVLDVGAEIIGVNNRNLSTMQLCMDTSLRLAPLLPKEKVKIAESGINSSNYIKELEKIGFDAALVGEALLRAEDAERKMEQWLR